MNFEMIVRSNKDGRFIVVCPNFPDCSGEGVSIEDAVEEVIEKISDCVAKNIKETFKDAMREISKRLPESGSNPAEMSYLLTKFPVSLN